MFDRLRSCVVLTYVQVLTDQQGFTVKLTKPRAAQEQVPPHPMIRRTAIFFFKDEK